MLNALALDQTARMRRLIQTCAFPLEMYKMRLLYGQTVLTMTRPAYVRRIVCEYAVRICYKVGFIMLEAYNKTGRKKERIIKYA